MQNGHQRVMKCLASGNLEKQRQQKALTFLRGPAMMQVPRPLLTTTYWLCDLGNNTSLPSSVKWKSNGIYLKGLLQLNYLISVKHFQKYLVYNWPTVFYNLFVCAFLSAGDMKLDRRHPCPHELTF